MLVSCGACQGGVFWHQRLTDWTRHTGDVVRRSYRYRRALAHVCSHQLGLGACVFVDTPCQGTECDLRQCLAILFCVRSAPYTACHRATATVVLCLLQVHSWSMHAMLTMSFSPRCLLTLNGNTCRMHTGTHQRAKVLPTEGTKAGC